MTSVDKAEEVISIEQYDSRHVTAIRNRLFVRLPEHVDEILPGHAQADLLPGHPGTERQGKKEECCDKSFVCHIRCLIIQI